MTGRHPNIRQPEGTTDLSLQVPQDVINSEIARSTEPLNQYLERGGIGAENRRIIGEHVLQIADIIRDNPERVAADMAKPPQQRTEHDPERAHLAALAIDKNMTRLGKRFFPWQGAKRQQSILGVKLGENLAAEVYAENPAEAGPNVVESCRLQAAAGNIAYTYIKGAKLPRR